MTECRRRLEWGGTAAFAPAYLPSFTSLFLFSFFNRNGLQPQGTNNGDPDPYFHAGPAPPLFISDEQSGPRFC